MKDAVWNVIGFALLAVLFGPTLAGVIDASWYFYTDHTLTGIDWTEGRVWFAVGMPFLAGTLASVASL